MPKKINKTYYFSVEGDTEKWYLEWLKNMINNSDASKCKVQFVIKSYIDPIKMVKSLSIIGKTKITHIIDYESNTAPDIRRFQANLKSMKQAERLGKSVNYCLGYTNLTFELWMILHKMNCYGSLNDKRQYLRFINQAFDEAFEDLREYKYEKGFKRILGKITLEDVLCAIARAKEITRRSKADFDNYRETVCGYEYYTHNPSLSIWQSIESILGECGIIRS